MITCKCCLILALTLWYESRGESHEGRMAVASVVWNRAAESRGKYDLAWVVLRPHQFACWTGRDTRNLTEPICDKIEAGVWQDCVKIAESMVDGTFKATTTATHYYNPRYASPAWADQLADRTEIGNHVFGRCK